MNNFLHTCFLLLFFQAVAFGQNAFRGVVLDPNGAPLSGASITITGQKKQVVLSDSMGVFTIPQLDGIKKIVVSSIGYQSKDLDVKKMSVAGSNINKIVLDIAHKEMDEVVVVGYGTTKRQNLTGAETKIDTKDIDNLITPSIDKQLAGRAAGLQISGASGLVNQPPNVTIRGVNSINQGTGPLYVVDGIPILTGNLTSNDGVNGNPLGDINPSDIENIEVLKDGSATAIYGSRASGGVILITTKKGTKGKIKFNYDGFFANTQIAKKWKLLNNTQFVKIANEKRTNLGLTPLARDTATNTDWQDVAFVKNAFSTNQNFSLQGGGDKSSYYLSMNYSKQQGAVISNSNTSYRVRLNLDQTVNQYFKIGNYITLSRQFDTDENNGTATLGGAVLSSLVQLPNLSPYNKNGFDGYNATDGNLMFNGPNLQGSTANFFNLAFTLKQDRYTSDKYRILNNSYIEVAPVKGLTLRSQFGIDYFNAYDFLTWDPRYGDGYPYGTLANSNITFLRYVWQNYFTYDLTIKNNHNFVLTGGYELQKTTNKTFNASGQNILDRFFIANNIISGASSIQNIGGDYSQVGYESFFGRLNYDYKGTYLFQASFRRDGQSALAAGKKFGTFPGFSLGWRFAKENFWQNNEALASVFSDAKIRFSYARTGNTLTNPNNPNAGYFPYLNTYSATPYGEINGVGPTQIGNEDLRWETSDKYDVGVDFSFLNNRVTFTADYFLNAVNNLVLNVPTPPSAGIPNNSIAQNIGAMVNKGIELSVSATLIQTKNFDWDFAANFTSVKNKVTQLYDIGGKPVDYIRQGSFNILKVGQPYQALFGYRYAGVNTQNGNPMYFKADGTLVQHNIVNNTFYVAKDLNDGSLSQTTSALTDGDKVVLGNPTPTWFGSFTNTFRYKEISLQVMFRYSGGNTIFNYTRQRFLNNQSFWNNGVEILDRWTTPGQVTNTPKLYYGLDALVNQNGNALSRFTEDGSFLRLQNVVLTYTFKTNDIQKWTKGVMKTLRVYLQGQNLFVVTKFTGADPETITSQGIDILNSPQVRIYSCGIGAGF
ncbi:MAG: SusC/RagA family TonB-linked outer membrane protein [Phycisphaerales bacterium]|nr:SusC/RagA family TonB-linked outer membrane protein [Phycisphaerales bacterium]